MIVLHLTAIVFSYHHPEDGRTAGRSMLKVLQMQIHHNIAVHLLLSVRVAAVRQVQVQPSGRYRYSPQARHINVAVCSWQFLGVICRIPTLRMSGAIPPNPICLHCVHSYHCTFLPLPLSPFTSVFLSLYTLQHYQQLASHYKIQKCPLSRRQTDLPNKHINLSPREVWCRLYGGRWLKTLLPT